MTDDEKKQQRIKDENELKETLDAARNFLKQCTAEPRPSVEELMNMSRDYGERVYPRVMVQLSVGDYRNFFRQEFGDKTSKIEDKIIEGIADKIGQDKWEELVGFFSKLDITYEEHIRRPKDIEKQFKNQITLCHKLAMSLEDYNPHNWCQLLDSPFSGLIAKEVFNEDWLYALQSTERTYAPAVAKDIVTRCFIRLYLADPATFLARTLREYAAILESFSIDNHSAALLKVAHGKINFKEFTKRIVFNMIKACWPSKRAPNKETAYIVNIILGLDGNDSVTGNDISQMNKKTRRTYYKDT